MLLTSGPIELCIDYKKSVNYASLLNGRKIINSLTVKNISDLPLTGISVRFAGYYFPEAGSTPVDIAPGESRSITGPEVMPELSRLLTLNEAVYTEFQLSVMSGTKETASFRFPITIQAWNHWAANPDSMQDIASFVMPNHPYVIEIIGKASAILQSSSKYTVLSGYDVDDCGYVIEQIRAVWAALSAEKFKYLTINGNFNDSGQNIVTPEIISRNRNGSCLDLSLLLCSCLERIGLSPVLFFTPGHVVAGVWTDSGPRYFNAVTTAPEDIEGCCKGDCPALMLIESTDMCQDTSLDDAATLPQSLLNSMQCVVDIISARKAGVRPIPVDVTDTSVTEDNDIKGYNQSADESSRRQGWERKLLDFTLRNVMLNLKPGKNIVPIWQQDTSAVVSHIKNSRLAEVIGHPGKDNLEELKNLYRAARTSLEENGANSLFVSLGALRWFDVDDSRPHLAPLLFIPVSIVRKKAMTYEVRLRDGEEMINVTLVEMLRQMFGVTFPMLESLPEDADGFPDWQKVFDIFAENIVEINKRQPDDRQWELLFQSYIGIFSFKKFLMWHDIHYHPEVIERHHVLRGLIENRYQPDGEYPPADARSLEAGSPVDLMLPIDYDSSQLEAVSECHSGQSFVLHGPPGTGKSQTITNMIADALYAGKRVLFVAEKKAALDVVRSRLNAIGLEPYCLELHSNKADKRSFFSQVSGSGIADLGSHTRRSNRLRKYSAAADLLVAAQRHLHDITEAIHADREHSLSLYDYVNRLLAAGYSDLIMSYAEVEHLSPMEIDELCAEYRSLDLVAGIMGYHPGTSDLVGLYPRENTGDNQTGVTGALTGMPEAIAKARKKASSIFNRWFFKRTPEEILSQNILWQRLHDLAIVDSDKCDDIDTFERYINRWSGAIDRLRRWYHFSEKAAEISKYNLPKAFNYYLEDKGGQESADAVYGGYFRSLANHVIDSDHCLRGFSGRLHEDHIARYVGHVDDFQTLRKEELLRKMKNGIISANLSPDMEKQLALLSRRLQTNGRGVALRKIIAESSDVLGMIFPCMLMSPLSVAQYLDMLPGLFDIVIFDEASQMETPDAVGTIARGRSLVVVGDPRQLPPTRFFMAQTACGEDVEECEDSDSILEDCIALGMPSRYLSRHYRSRHESLIAFSNSNFYDNRLLTFPSHNDSERKVRFIDPGGVYDYGKSRTNRIEAEALVKYVINLIDNSEVAPSIGIVAFSKAQSNIIEDILNNALQRNKSAQTKLDEAAEPLFIKNLENVQGDERDIIIFSIGYGPDKNGNVSLNFGPINQTGGERRLNVAVSRAREEMIVFSSLLPRHIPSEGINAKGVTALRNFLAYAIDGNIEREEGPEADKEVIIDAIADKLRDKGLNVVTKVGRSTFKIDIAVVDEHNPDNYSLGIILDGRDYYNLPIVRDREITVPSVLRSLGWRLHRVWTIDWFDNPDAVLSDILNVC